MIFTKLMIYRFIFILITIFMLLLGFKKYPAFELLKISPQNISILNTHKCPLVKPTQRCYRHSFNDTLLVMNFNYPVYDSMPLLHQLYDEVFGKVLSCGPLATDNLTGPDIPYTEERTWFFRYRCLSKAMLLYPNYKGYLYSNDDVILNWWNLLKFDRNKIWQSAPTLEFNQPAYGEIIAKGWMWWKHPEGIEACQKYHKLLETLAQNKTNFRKLLSIFLTNGNGEARCGKGWSDVFYIPQIHMENFIYLSAVTYKSKLMSEIAAHNIMHTLDYSKNIVYINGTYLPDKGIWHNKFDSFWSNYNTNLTLIHPIKLNSKSDKEKQSMRSLVVSWILEYKHLLFKFEQC